MGWKQFYLNLAEEKYLDMKERGIWHQVDPRDAQLMSLTTQLRELKEARTTEATALATTGENKGGTSSELPFDLQNKKTWTKIKGSRIFTWRTIYKGDTIVVLGKTNYWCPLCKMYGFHKPEKCNKKSDENKSSSQAKNDGQSGSTPNLGFTKELKSVLSTQLCISDEDIDKMFERSGAPGN